MPLNKLIDLIAEVAVKRTTQKGERERETPDAVQPPYWFHWGFQCHFHAWGVFLDCLRLKSLDN